MIVATLVVAVLAWIALTVWLLTPHAPVLASRERKVRYWEDRLADLEHHRDGWRWAASPSEARAEDEAIAVARLKLAALSVRPEAHSGVRAS